MFIMEELTLENILTYFNWTRLSKFKCTHIFAFYMVLFKQIYVLTLVFYTRLVYRLSKFICFPNVGNAILKLC